MLKSLPVTGPHVSAIVVSPRSLSFALKKGTPYTKMVPSSPDENRYRPSFEMTTLRTRPTWHAYST